MSTILSIDTASDAFALTVDRDGAVNSVQIPGGHDHSRLLLPSIRDIFGEDRPDGILVVIRPGAYAGAQRAGGPAHAARAAGPADDAEPPPAEACAFPAAEAESADRR